MPRKTKSIPISFNTTGDNTVVAALSNGQINVYGILFTVDAATNITVKSGATALTGALVFTGNGSSMTLELNMDEPYFYCPTNTPFIMNQSGTAQVSGVAYYTSG